jgi:hypothetical protein
MRGTDREVPNVEKGINMHVYCKGTARIKHKVTGVVYDVERDELGWDAVGSEERQMGPEIHYEAVVEHPELGLLSWSLWEYPVGIQNHNQTDVGEHELIEDVDYELEAERGLWVDYDIPENPFTIFMDSYHHTGDLLAEYGSDSGFHLVNRMIFSQQITALEAYLGDTLIKAVLIDREAINRLLTKDAELSKERVFRWRRSRVIRALLIRPRLARNTSISPAIMCGARQSN